MKKIAIFILLASATSPAKKVPEYNLTGEITILVNQHFDFESHLSTRRGDVDVYCNASSDGTSVSCYDHLPEPTVALADGSSATNRISPLWIVQGKSDKWCYEPSQIGTTICDPLNDIIWQMLKMDTSKLGPYANRIVNKFQYRLAKNQLGGLMFCMARTDPEGERKHKETCYTK